jgi:hypothetical protein
MIYLTIKSAAQLKVHRSGLRCLVVDYSSFNYNEILLLETSLVLVL